MQKFKFFSVKSLKLNHSNFIHPTFGCSNQQYETGIKRHPKIGLHRAARKGEIIFEEMMEEQILRALRREKSWFQSQPGWRLLISCVQQINLGGQQIAF